MVFHPKGKYTVCMENGFGTKGFALLAGAAIIVFAALGVLLATLSRPVTPSIGQITPSGINAPLPLPNAALEKGSSVNAAPILSTNPVSVSDILSRRQLLAPPPTTRSIAPAANTAAPPAVTATPIAPAPPANPNLTPDQQLLAAMTKGDFASIRDAIQRGANVNPADTSQGTPLLWAIANGDYGMMEDLLSRGANVNARLVTGETPLMAAPSQKILFVRRLIEVGAEVNARSKEDDTALISACRAANVEAASLMLQAGADARVKNKQGETALALATAGNLTALIPLLHQAGASE
jgi:ankyrin repeat protein